MNPATAALLIGMMAIGHDARATEVWLAGGGDPAAPAASTSDFLALFEPGAPWRSAASKINVLQVTTQFIIRSKDADLARTLQWLEQHHMALAVEVGFLYGAGRCGYHVEGFAAHHTARLLATRIKNLGGTLAYAAMDEPLWFGRHANRPTACHWEIPDIISEIAEGVAEIHAVFPAARIGDIEPIGVSISTSWPDEIMIFADAYRRVVGAPLAFLRADIQWQAEWRGQLKSIAAKTTAAGIPLGLIIDSDRPGQSNLEWTDRAERCFADARAVLGRLPEQLVFQSWQVHPEHFLPEDEPGTLTNLVKHVSP
jgi:hypothetical protein